MAKNVALWGAVYTDTPALTVPVQGGGTALFVDTSDSNAIASDIASGKTAYVNGEKITGTASGGAISVVDTTDAGGGTIRTISGVPAPAGKITITENDTDIDIAQYALADVIVSGGGSTTYTATFIGTQGGNASCYVIHDGITYTNKTGTFTFTAGDTLTCHRATYAETTIYIGDRAIDHANDYTFNLPASDIEIELYYGSDGYIHIFILDPTSVPEVTEEGTWTPAENVARGTVTFNNAHAKAPYMVYLMDTTGTALNTTGFNIMFYYFDVWDAYGVGVPYTTSNEQSVRYAMATYAYRASGSPLGGTVFCSHKSSDSGSDTVDYPKYWCTANAFFPYTNLTSRYWRSDRTYKWVAKWTPYL